jgi:tRNA pseudouridine38-40 synthase
MTTKIVLVVEYDGTGYHGFQLQPGLPTIQVEVERAWWHLTGERRRVMAASRTDAGVHAQGQVVSLRTDSVLPITNFIDGLNYYLPVDIAVKAAYRVDDSFNVRREAVSREYDYSIQNSPTRSPLRRGCSYQVAPRLDTVTMNQACRALVGEHDFVSFASSLKDRGKSTSRRMYRAEIEEYGELMVLHMVANAFLTHQVRNTVGALVRVGQGKMSIEEFCSILEAKELGLARPAAPARGLCLMRVNYPRPLEEMFVEDL